MAKRPAEPSRRPRISMIAEQAALSSFYKLGDTVGTGGFGKVKLATHNLTGVTVAIKIMDKKALGDDFLRAEQEVELLQTMRHPRICELYQVINTSDKLYLVMEHCANGELFDYLMEKERLEEDVARDFFRQILSAVAFLHSRSVFHRDLKPENLLLDDKQNIRLIDFGLAARVKPGMNALLETCCGSPAYVAPELIAGAPYSGGQADIWSLGILLYALVVGTLPFNHDDVNKLFKKIQSGVFEIPRCLSRECRILIRSMLQVDPMKRIEMQALVKNEWVVGQYGQPVRVQFVEEGRVDGHILNLMFPLAPLKGVEMTQSVNNKAYDYWHATYLILKSRSRQGKSLTLNYPLSHNNVSHLHTPAFRSPSAPSAPSAPFTLPPSTPVRYDSDPHLDVSFDHDDDSDTSMSVASSANPSVESVMESSRPVLRETNGGFRAPAPWVGEKPVASPPSNKEGGQGGLGGLGGQGGLPSPRLTPSRSWGAHLDREDKNSSGGDYRRSAREKSQSMEDGLENVCLLTPQNSKQSQQKKTNTNTTRLPEGGLTVRKMFNSVEKGLNRFRDALTPGKISSALTPGKIASSAGRQLRQLKRDCITNNVTMVQSTDAAAVLDGIKQALSDCGYTWKIKKGFIVRAKKVTGQGQLLLKLSLEVVWITTRNGVNSCGIRRQRIEGDGMQYKKLYADLYSHILNIANAQTAAAVPSRLSFDC